MAAVIQCESLMDVTFLPDLLDHATPQVTGADRDDEEQPDRFAHGATAKRAATSALASMVPAARGTAAFRARIGAGAA